MAPAAVTGLPQDIAPAAREHLEHLTARITARQDTLGERTAIEAPGWALDALGPVPTEQSARAQWVERAGIVAGHREATGYDNDAQPLGTMPGVSATERRASYAQAWDALGRPEAGLDEAAMSEGQLRVRVRAAQAELNWAPPYVDDTLREAETARETARQAAALARAQAAQALQIGDLDAAEKYAADAADREQAAAVNEAAIGPLTETAQTRATWAGSTAVTLDAGGRSWVELQRRGISLGDEPDRTDTQTWLAAERAARTADDEHRVITETDLTDEQTAQDAHEHAATIDVGELDQLPETAAQDEQWDRDLTTTDDAAIQSGEQVAETDEPVEAAEAAGAGQDEPSAEVTSPAAGTSVIEPDLGAGQEKGWGRSRAHAVLQATADAEQIEAAATVAALSLATALDRASQDASYTDPADLDDTQDHERADMGESADQARRRREGADDLDHQRAAAATAGREAGMDLSSDG
jgi:hypothetical protein